LPIFRTMVDLLDDAVRIGGPCKWPRGVVVPCREAVDRLLERRQGRETAALASLLAQPGKESLDRITRGAGGWGELKRAARVVLQPSQHFSMLVGAIVVEDAVDRLAGRYRHLDRVHEADQHLVVMLLHAPAGHRVIWPARSSQFPRQGATLLRSPGLPAFDQYSIWRQ
jgi:hypothetical protein